MFEAVMSEPVRAATARRLTVRLALDAADLAAVQHLRWRIFFEEMGAAATDTAGTVDAVAYDALCDHLLVIDEDAPAADCVVGTYRLLRESIARAHERFYSAGEFDLSTLTEGPARPAGELLEPGRSCVLARYIARHDIGLMFGCASFPGTDPAAHAPGLSYLYHHHLADAQRRPRVLDARVQDVQAVPLEQLARGTYTNLH